jgi:NADH-quinone oxidoreductase subunit J
LSEESQHGNFPAAAEPKQVAAALYAPYLIGVELASMLLLAGIVGAYHLGWRKAGKGDS